MAEADTGSTEGSPEGGGGDRLSGRELLILQLLARGYAREQIAALLALTQTGLASHERGACAALGASDTEDALARADERGLVIAGGAGLSFRGSDTPRYVVREDTRSDGFRVYDVEAGTWVADLPAFSARRTAEAAARARNQHLRGHAGARWLDDQDPVRGRT